MSFIRLLAAGRSIAGLRKSRGPFKMTQENLLPHFEPLQADGKPPAAPAGSTLDLFASSHAGAVADAASVENAPGAEKREAGRKTSMFSCWKWPLKKLGSLLRRGPRGPRLKSQPRRQVQSEFPLAQIRVVRNDLSDSDIELIPAMKRTSPSPRQGVVAGNGRMQPFGLIWNRLSAPLLRRAAQEFHTSQKERGKLLAQTGPEGGGARGT
jgi:hypothetical protein